MEIIENFRLTCLYGTKRRIAKFMGFGDIQYNKLIYIYLSIKIELCINRL